MDHVLVRLILILGKKKKKKEFVDSVTRCTLEKELLNKDGAGSMNSLAECACEWCDDGHYNH